MKLTTLVMCSAMFVSLASGACAVTLTFDDIPQGMGLEYYSVGYGIGIGSGFYAADHTGSTWGPPHSPSHVLAWSYPGFWSNWYGMMFKKDQPLYADSVGGYFSTQPGVVLEMIGYYQGLNDPVASVTIGDSQGAWNNVHVQINSTQGMNIIEFRPVTTDALSHFCADDISVNFLPEPSSLLALAAEIGGMWGLWRRRR